MIMDNSIIIPWLSSLDFQVTINNKARFMIFFINIFPSFYHFLGLFVICFSLKFSPSSLQKINSQLYIFLIIIHVVFYYIFPGSFLKVSKHSIKVFLKKNFLKFIFTHFVFIGWNLLRPSSLSKTKIQFLHKFIYFYFLMFSNLGCS